MATSEVWWIGTWVSKTVSLLCLAVEVATILEPDCSLSLMLPVSLAFADTMTACLVDSFSNSAEPTFGFLVGAAFSSAGAASSSASLSPGGSRWGGFLGDLVRVRLRVRVRG